MGPSVGVRSIKQRPHEMTDAVTATDDVFVLAHLGVPRVDPARWSLVIDGLVRRTRILTLDELRARPKKIVEAVHQCCGNPLEPTVATRRIANVRWGGADLVMLLDELGIDPLARYLWSYGLDGREFAGTTCDWFIKDLPLARLAGGDVLLAHELNGMPLPAEHGFPVRLAVPGYYGTNSVKSRQSALLRRHMRRLRDRANGQARFREYEPRCDPGTATIPLRPAAGSCRGGNASRTVHAETISSRVGQAA